MKVKQTFVLTALLYLSMSITEAYEVKTHIDLSKGAAARSSLAYSDLVLIRNIGLHLPIESRSRQVLQNSKGEWKTILDLIADGSEFEDDSGRVFNHFYDPQHDRPLTLGGLAIGDTSMDWALEDERDEQSVTHHQDYSLKDAREYLYEAITSDSFETRWKRYGQLFQSLGQVIHHIQDMAQPQHVRNDDHCGEWFCRLVPLAYKKSSFEKYAFELTESLPDGVYNGGEPVQLPSWRAFWLDDSERGIAQFAAYNFVSVATNFRGRPGQTRTDPEYPRPGTSDAVVTVRQVTDPNLLGPPGPGQQLQGDITFVGTPVHDAYTGETTFNPRTSSYSLFDADLAVYGFEKVFTLNRFNYDTALEYLVPRAVAYSAGLIDHFFRGRIEISLPEEGVYGMLDHATTNDIDDGFKILKMRLRNATPDIEVPGEPAIPQEMTGGMLQAIVKYRRNPCYAPDLTGEFHKIDGQLKIYSGCPTEMHHSAPEEIARSETIILEEGLSSEQSTEFTFDFTEELVPINAWDIYLQVVYRGQLGEENDAVVVSTKDIAEPTYFTTINNSGLIEISGEFYSHEEIRSDQPLWSQISPDEDAANAVLDRNPPIDSAILSLEFEDGPSVGGTPDLPPSAYSRFVILADLEGYFLTNRHLRFNDAAHTWPTTVNEVNWDNGIVGVAPYSRARGISMSNRSFLVQRIAFGDPINEDLDAITKPLTRGIQPSELHFE